MIQNSFIQLKSITLSFIKRSYKNAASILFHQVFPAILFLILLIVFGTAGWENYAKIRVAIVNTDDSAFSVQFIEDLQTLSSVEWSSISASKAEDYILSNKVHAVLYIPEDFTEVLTAGNMPGVTIKGLSSADSARGMAEIVKHEIAILRAIAQNSDDFYEAYNVYRSERSVIDSYPVEPAEKVSGYLSFGFLLLFLFSRAYTSVRLLLEDRQNGTYDRIRTTPVNGIIYMGGCLLAGFITQMAQIILALGAAVIIFGYSMPGGFIPVILLLAAYNAAILGFSLLIVALVPSLEVANTISSLLLTVMCMLGGCYWHIDLIPELIQKIGWLVPQYWTMKGIDQLISGGSLADISTSLLVLTGYTAVFLVLNSIVMNRTGKLSRGLA